MWAKIKGWFELRELTGLEIRLGADGVEAVHACRLQLSGDRLSVTDQHEGLKNIAHFGKHYKAGPVALCLSGRGILVKKIQPVPAVDQHVIQQVLPNANIGEFYCQLENAAGEGRAADHAVLSLIRKSVADPLIAALSALGFQVVSLRLGHPPGEKAGSKIKPELVPAYSAAFGVLLAQEHPEVENQELNENKIQVFAKAKVMGIAAVFGCALLVLLLLNFFLFTHYQAEAGKLTFRKTRSGQEVKKFQQMESGIARKTSLITSAGWTGGYPYAWLTGQLMTGRPAAVEITLFSINPLKAQALVTSREEVYETGKIRISGTCDKAATLNNWLFEIRAREWVKDCSIKAYELNKESGKGQFTIDIDISDYEG
jgi:hypothetical protein